MDFFPDPPERTDHDEPDEPRRAQWMGPPDDVLAGVVPVELVLGRSENTAVLLHGIRAFPAGLEMTLGVRIRRRPGRRDLHEEVFDGPYSHDMDGEWESGRLKWGFELADGRRVTNVDPSPYNEQPNREHPHSHTPEDLAWAPERPVLQGGGGGGGPRSVDRQYWLWPLPPAGPLRVACQWPAQEIPLTVHDLDAAPFLDAAARSRPVWSPPPLR